MAEMSHGLGVVVGASLKGHSVEGNKARVVMYTLSLFRPRSLSTPGPNAMVVMVGSQGVLLRFALSSDLQQSSKQQQPPATNSSQR